MNLPHQLDRVVTINAPRDLVFSFFTDSGRWASWWGAGSTIEASPGGRLTIRLPGGVEVSGEVLSLTSPRQIVFTYGYASGQPFAPGESRVTITLEPDGGATRLHLVHEFKDAASRDEHVQGWRYQLSLFGNVVLDLVHAGVEPVVDRWLALWSQPDDGARMAVLGELAISSVAFRDRYSLIDGAGELSAHIAAYQRFMPGLTLQRSGAVRHCQGTVLADWAAVAADGATRATGTNVFVFGADGKIQTVVGFWR